MEMIYIQPEQALDCWPALFYGCHDSVDEYWLAFLTNSVTPLVYFYGWHLLAVDESGSLPYNHAHTTDVYLDATNINQVSLNAVETFSEEIYATLLTLSTGLMTPPGTYFMWENSD